MIFIPIILIALFVIVILFTGYVKARPDTAIIISGLKKKPRILIGQAGIKIPFLERKDELSLELVSIDVKTSSAVPTADYINIAVDATVNVKISDKVELLQLAAQNFLNKKTDYISKVAREVLEGNVREIVGKMNLEEMVSDRQKFANLVKENAEPDLAAMGLDIVSFNVQNFVDENGVIENLGVDNIVKIQKQAAISRAESEKEIAVARAKAKKEANDATVKADLEIANAQAKATKEKSLVEIETKRESQEAAISANTLIAQKENELEIKKAELKKEADAKKAMADAAYQIQKEAERKTIEIETANANLARQEKEVILKQKEVEIKEQSLAAEIKKKAEAEKFAKQQEAEAQLFERQKNAEAEKFEREKEAEAMKAEAEAKKYSMEQEAEGIRAKGLAEAEAIRAKAVAEADGILKKAEAMKQMEQAAVLEMYFNALPEIVKNAAAPLANVDRITMFGDGNSSKLTRDVINVTTQVLEGLKESTGIDLTGLAGDFLKKKSADNKEVTAPTEMDFREVEDPFDDPTK